MLVIVSLDIFLFIEDNFSNRFNAVVAKIVNSSIFSISSFKFSNLQVMYFELSIKSFILVNICFDSSFLSFINLESFSFTVIVWLTSISYNTSFFPELHSTTKESILDTFPSPKCNSSETDDK